MSILYPELRQNVSQDNMGRNTRNYVLDYSAKLSQVRQATFPVENPVTNDYLSVLPRILSMPNSEGDKEISFSKIFT